MSLQQEGDSAYSSTYDSIGELSPDSYGEGSHTSHDEDRVEVHLLSYQPTRKPAQSLLASVTDFISWRKIKRYASRKANRVKRGRIDISAWLQWFLLCGYAFLGLLFAIIIIVGIFSPSYTTLPPHYKSLRDRVQDGWKAGSANFGQEKVYIAASLFDPGGILAGGDWAKNVVDLVHILGPQNVYLSIYENDSGEEAADALARLESKIHCNYSLIAEAHFALEQVPRITLPDGSQRIKRTAYLAEVRNRALRPLEQAQTRFDKLLYLNDVVFDPIDAAQLLFSTNVDAEGQAQYRSACAVDFISPFKFYDTFATRDLSGFSMGVPFFPWFATGGSINTLDDLLNDSDAVRVRSCWGGMVAFDAQFFQPQPGATDILLTAGHGSPSNISTPYRFRADEDLWWDASECCLIHADIQSPDTTDPGVLVNPYIRVAYDSRTLTWLWLTRRIEKLFIPVHIIADVFANLPDFNPRRNEVPWHTVKEVIWTNDDSGSGNGRWRKILRTAKHDGFCGRRGLQVMKEGPGRLDDKNWESIEPPPFSLNRG